MALTPQEVARLAALSRLELTESECAELAPELEVILGSVARVGEVAGDDVPLMTHALPLTNVMRPDRVREYLLQPHRSFDSRLGLCTLSSLCKSNT